MPRGPDETTAVMTTDRLSTFVDKEPAAAPRVAPAGLSSGRRTAPGHASPKRESHRESDRRLLTLRTPASSGRQLRSPLQGTARPSCDGGFLEWEDEGMRAVRIHAKQDMRTEQVPSPEPDAEEVRLRVGYVGICGSDLHYYADGAAGIFAIREPLIPGHEVSGVIDLDPTGAFEAGTR